MVRLRLRHGPDAIDETCPANAVADPFSEGCVLSPLVLSLLAAVAVTQLAIFSTTIYLHRSATHRGLALHPAAAFGFRFALWLTTGISTKEWVAVHRKHHAFTDQEGDPHSPLLKGFWRVQLGNVFYYVREARNVAVIEKYAPDIKHDFWDRWLFNYGTAGPLLGTAIMCAAFGLWYGLLGSVLHAITYVFVLSASINGLCHHAGYKNFGNTATNLRLLALITGGEGLHNNHHAFPRSPKFSVGRRELDPAWPIVQLLTRLRLARAQPVIERGSMWSAG
jgi:stearoyl-CoA desaturase (delta-9 desaturase)